MDSVYASPADPRLPIGNEAQLAAAADAGLLVETHYLEVKRLVRPPSRKNNLETAADLAGSAVDGGTYLIGASETAQHTVDLTPQPLPGLAERLGQIALTACDPPLAVTFREIATAADPTSGYRLVYVPQSPDAPHMVDGQYRGRGDKTKWGTRTSTPRLRRAHALYEGVSRPEARAHGEVCRWTIESQSGPDS